MNDPKTNKKASAAPAFGAVIDDIEALIRRGSKAAQEDVSSLPGANHDEKTPATAKGDYPLEPDPMSEATRSTEGKGDGTKAPTHDKSPQETDAGTASSEQPGEMPMVTDDEDKGAGKQANELLRAIKTAGDLLGNSERGAAPAAQKKAQEGGAAPATQKKAQEGGGDSAPATPAPPAEAPPAEAAPAAGDDEKIAKQKNKCAEYMNLTTDVLSKIAALVLADEKGQRDTFQTLQRLVGEKAANDAMDILAGLDTQLQPYAAQKLAQDDANALHLQLSKEAAEVGMSLPDYIRGLQWCEQVEKAAAENNMTPEQYLQAMDAQQAAPSRKQPARPQSRGQKLAQAIIDAAAAGELPDELAPELGEEEAAEIAIAEMIESGEITPEEILEIVAELEGGGMGDPMAGGMGDPMAGGEGDMIDELVADAAVPGDSGELGAVPDAVAADAAESVIPPEKLAGDKLASLLARKLAKPKSKK